MALFVVIFGSVAGPHNCMRRKMKHTALGTTLATSKHALRLIGLVELGRDHHESQTREVSHDYP